MRVLTSIICLALVLALSSGMANAALVAHWTFDEGSGTIAHDSAGSNNGTIQGATWTTGHPAGQLSFDHVNDYIRVPDAPSLRFSQSSSFSIAFWANVNLGFMVISKMQNIGQSGVFCYEIDYSSGSKKCYNFSVAKSDVSWTTIHTGTNSVPTGTWNFITAVYNNKNMQIYLNGELKSSGTFAYDTGTTTSTSDLGIGARIINGSPESGWYFGGNLDDMRIYNEALNASDIMQLYQTTPEPATLALLALGGLLLRRRIS